MAQSHLEQVLTATGLPADQVKALVELPADKADFKTDDYVTPIRSNVETQVRNDPKFYEGLNKENLPREFLQKLESEQYGRSAAIVRANMLKATGLTDKDFADLGEEGKKIDVFTAAFTKRLSEGKVGDKELQAKLMEANTKIADLEGGLPAIEEKYKTQYQAQIAEHQLASGVLTHLATVTGLKAPAKYLVKDIASTLKSKYGIVVGEDGQVQVTQKDKPTLKVLTDNGTKELTLSGAINLILETDDLVDKKKSTTTSTTVLTDVVTDKGTLKISKGVSDKIAKRNAEDLKAAGGTA